MILSPISFGVVGLAMALFANGLPLLGVDAPQEGQPSPTKTVAMVGSFAGAFTLIFFALAIILGHPLGTTDPAAVRTQILFASLGGKFGLLWIGVFITQAMGWDMRPIGSMCLLMALLQATEMGILAYYGPITTHLVIIEVVFTVYVLVLLGFWAVTHGKVGPKPVGWICMLGTLGTFYLQFVAGGVLPQPA
jgi:hypothetical protein